MTENEPLTVEFEYTRADFVGAYRLSGAWKRHVLYAAIFFAMAGPVTYQAMHEEKRELFFIAGFLFIIVAAIMLVGRNDYVGALSRIWKRGPHKFVFSDKGVLVLGGQGEILTAWEEFSEARVSPDVVLLFRAPNHFLVVPLRSIRSLQAVDGFLELIERKIPRRPGTRSA